VARPSPNAGGGTTGWGGREAPRHTDGGADLHGRLAANASSAAAVLGIEVDVQPFASDVSGSVGGEADDRGSDPATLVVGTGLCVEQEGVIAAVPGDVDEADQCAVGEAGRYPAKAVRAHLVTPASGGAAAVGRRELGELVIGERVSPPQAS